MNLKLALLPLLGVVALLTAACDESGDTIVQTGGMPLSGISATGTGEAIGEPDVMVISVGVNAERASIADAREAAAQAQTAVIEALKRNGVAEKDIQTIQFSVNPQYDFTGRTRDITGYQVSNVVRAKVRDLNKAGVVIDAATAAGGDDSVVQGLSFGIDDPTELQKEAREEAVSKAREQAEQLADNAGVKLGKLLSISENRGGQAFDTDVIRAPQTGAGSIESPFETGELSVSITVTLLYAVD